MVRGRRAVWISIAGLALLAALSWWLWPRLMARHQRELARQAIDAGNATEAVAHLASARDLRPDDVDISFELARALRRAERLAEARSELRRCEDLGYDRQALDLEYLLLEAQLNPDQRVQLALLRLLQDKHPQSQLVYEALARGYLNIRDLNAVEGLTSDWKQRFPDDWQAYFYQGVALDLGQQYLLSTGLNRAIENYERVLELKPDHGPALLLLAEARELLGLCAEALPSFERYYELRPDDPAGMVGVAKCQHALGQSDQARATLDQWFSRHGESWVQRHRDSTPMFVHKMGEALLLRGELELAHGSQEAALGWLARAEVFTPMHADLLYTLLTVLRRAGRNEEADRYEARWRAVKDLIGRLERAQADIAREPNSLTRRFEIGSLQLQLGQERAGFFWLRRVLELDPNHEPTHRLLAEHFEKAGNRKQAEYHRQRLDKSSKGQS